MAKTESVAAQMKELLDEIDREENNTIINIDEEARKQEIKNLRKQELENMRQ